MKDITQLNFNLGTYCFIITMLFSSVFAKSVRFAKFALKIFPLNSHARRKGGQLPWNSKGARVVEFLFSRFLLWERSPDVQEEVFPFRMLCEPGSVARANKQHASACLPPKFSWNISFFQNQPPRRSMEKEVIVTVSQPFEPARRWDSLCRIPSVLFWFHIQTQ